MHHITCHRQHISIKSVLKSIPYKKPQEKSTDENEIPLKQLKTRMKKMTQEAQKEYCLRIDELCAIRRRRDEQQEKYSQRLDELCTINRRLDEQQEKKPVYTSEYTHNELKNHKVTEEP